MYIVRSGLIYHSLGNIYSRSYKTTSGSNRKKKLLNLCRLYFEKGVKIFQSINAPIELLAVQVDRLEFQNILFEGTSDQFEENIKCSMNVQFRSSHNSLCP